MSTLARALTIAVLVVNVGDIALHVAIDDVEPLRISGNVVVLLAAMLMLTMSRAGQALVPLIAGAVSLALNLVFIATEGIGPLGGVLVATTSLLLAGATLALRRRA